MFKTMLKTMPNAKALLSKLVQAGATVRPRLPVAAVGFAKLRFMQELVVPESRAVLKSLRPGRHWIARGGAVA